MIVRRRAPQSPAGSALRHRFARNVRHFRTTRGMTQNQLASAAGLGRTFISQVEQGRFSVTLETIGALSTALGICPTMLMQLPD
jgi:DNA-binding XRE family transcriptional regulator